MLLSLSADEQLCTLLQQKDREALSDLYDRYAPMLYGEIIRVLKGHPGAEYILVKTFLHIHSHFNEYDMTKGRLFSWILGVARSMAVAHLEIRSGERKQ